MCCVWGEGSGVLCEGEGGSVFGNTVCVYVLVV